MSCKDRRETDAIGRPIDIKNYTPKVRPWTPEEAYIAKLANWVRTRKREQLWSDEREMYLTEAVFVRYRNAELDYKRLLDATYLDESGEVLEAIGMMFLQRMSSDLDTSKGCRFLELAYERGVDLRPELYITMGSLREVGDEIITKDPELALKWYQKALDGGVKFAYACIGDLYFKGDIGEKDYQKAYELFIKSGEKEALCLARLGEMYERGLYVEKDLVKAREYYERIIKDRSDYEKYGDDDYEFARNRLEEKDKSTSIGRRCQDG